jgi:hypothetical protein
MKKRVITGAAVVLALAALAGCKTAPTATVQPSGGAVGTPRLMPIPGASGPSAYYATGTLRPAGAPGLCLTRMAVVISGDPVVTTRCVEGDALQQWYMYRIHGAGEIMPLADPDLQIGQEGDTNFQVRLFDTREQQNAGLTSIVHWNLADKNIWHVYIVGVKNSTLFMSARPRTITTRADIAVWLKSTTLKNWSQEWITPEWKVLEGNPE